MNAAVWAKKRWNLLHLAFSAGAVNHFHKEMTFVEPMAS